jgi:mannose-6-phosphate isomerase class I
MTDRLQYDKHPRILVDDDEQLCTLGWRDIGDRLRGEWPQARVVCVECYPGSFVNEIEEGLSTQLRPDIIVSAANAFRQPADIDRIVHPFLTDDPVFGLMNDVGLEDLFDRARFIELQQRIRAASGTLTLVIGTGASLLAPDWDVLIYADMARWEIQQRQRKNRVGNLGVENSTDPPALKYKRAFFVDWRIADRLKQRLLKRIDFLLDTTLPGSPKLVAGNDFRRGLEIATQRPFRVVPFFDPGLWGGSWMKEQFNLPRDKPNYAWCFDCVPEENSLLLAFGRRHIEVPSLDVVFYRPKELLGDSVVRRFGAEFPIRFDLLDTMNGGNLSLQVHPLTSYIREHFGMSYTQDESYYLLDAAPDASVFLGLKEGIDRKQMIADLRNAQQDGNPFPAEQYVNKWPAHKHDHFLIPGGTIHCSGKNSVVLEISATPYIFTFKLWDWGRLGLDGRPRPIHLEHGIANIQWNRTTDWVRKDLVNHIKPVAQGPCWREERTGLHSLEFIETRRHWFTGPVSHCTGDSVNVLNLVEGREAVVESPNGAFQPFTIHYAETFIVPAALGCFTIRPLECAGECATVKASIRSESAH